MDDDGKQPPTSAALLISVTLLAGLVIVLAFGASFQRVDPPGVNLGGRVLPVLDRPAEDRPSHPSTVAGPKELTDARRDQRPSGARSMR